MESKKIYLAWWCFWWIEELFREEKWVISTEVWYTWWYTDNPTYQDHEWHAEAIEVTYNPEETSFIKLLDFFFRIHNPTTLNQQWNDKGSSYRSTIFYQNDEELQEAKDFIEIVNNSGRWQDRVVTTLEKFDKFFVAENYHQDYLQANPLGYTCHYVRLWTYL